METVRFELEKHGSKITQVKALKALLDLRMKIILILYQGNNGKFYGHHSRSKQCYKQEKYIFDNRLLKISSRVSFDCNIVCFINDNLRKFE